MKISEMFVSIDGEGITAGYPAIFLRSFGCSLRCTYCDSMYAVEPECTDNMSKCYEEYSVDQIVEYCNQVRKEQNIRHVTVTGGEPLIQSDCKKLIEILCETNFIVNIETNGKEDISEYIQYPNAIITMDWKSESSGMSNYMNAENLYLLRNTDCLKFVVGTADDLVQMRSLYLSRDKYNLRCNMFVSPIFGKIQPAEIVKYILDNGLSDIRMQLQLHKVIWDPNRRGV